MCVTPARALRQALLEVLRGRVQGMLGTDGFEQRNLLRAAHDVHQRDAVTFADFDEHLS